MPHKFYYALVALTLGTSVALNTYFLWTNLYITVGLLWAVAEVVAFAFPRKVWSVPIKLFVQVNSLLLTFMVCTSLIQQDTQELNRTTAQQNNSAIRIAQIDARLTAIQDPRTYTNIEPVYESKRTKINKELQGLYNTPFTYYKKTLPETFIEASENCTSTTKKSAKVTRDYPDVCRDIKAKQSQLIALDQEYNSESKRQSEMARLTDERTQLVEDSPNLGQNNIRGLTEQLSTVVDISNLADNLLLIMVFGVCLVVFAVNMAFSLKLVIPQAFDPNNMRTANGLTAHDPAQVIASLNIPLSVTCNTKSDSKFARVLTETVRHHTPGVAVNKETIKGYKKCSNDIAQAVITTLAHNNLLQKDKQSWQWC